MDEKIREIVEIFEKISRIPRCSKNEEKIASWLETWARNRGFSIRSDAAGNRVVKVPGSRGFEKLPGVVLQGHMDMVCEKSAESKHDFSSDPIRVKREGEWLKADGTSLGADNGIGMALAMAAAEDDSFRRPPLELLFTVDEETGLTGASALEPGFIEGKILLNLDSEEEGEFTVGCAGGRDTHIRMPIRKIAPDTHFDIYILTASGMRGGHSGVDIGKQRANAIKILARLLDRIYGRFSPLLVDIGGGSAHNAIARQAWAKIALPAENFQEIQILVKDFSDKVRTEYGELEPDLKISLEAPKEKGSKNETALSEKDSRKTIELLMALFHGVYGMSRDIEGLVETSANLATVKLEENNVEIVTSQRSSSMSRLEEITASIESAAHLAGCGTENKHDYPAWRPRMDSALLARCEKTYEKLFNRRPVVKAIHAGLECAVIGAKYPALDMISLGPSIENAHSPDEKLSIPTIGRVWEFLRALLSSLASSPMQDI